MGWNVSNCHLITDKLPLGSVDLFCFLLTTIVSLTYYREIVGWLHACYELRFFKDHKVIFLFYS